MLNKPVWFRFSLYDILGILNWSQNIVLKWYTMSYSTGNSGLIHYSNECFVITQKYNSETGYEKWTYF